MCNMMTVCIVRIAFFCNLDIRSMVVPQTSEPKLT